ncbi:hypothetical protein [Alicyclobacillus ferrooxydans]|uniref:Uncharacterized protein n=1 Tax=Alicyclobacillus ferrooxydans TaxID=471514 RepID=A0A0P9CZV6_9BACL|nr:hypothetical protein [Alicyclobacillus ferrooxydans]KPV42690.1 hypothetical protein AN477_16290 [Alicyclobacillus ferrooxydans]
MRDLIAAILLSIFLYFFAWQPFQDELNANKSLLIQNIVHNSLSQASVTTGYFTTSDLLSIQAEVANDLGYPTSEVTVIGTTTPQTRGGLLSLTISVPTSLTFVHIPSTEVVPITQSETAMSEVLQ